MMLGSRIFLYIAIAQCLGAEALAPKGSGRGHIKEAVPSSGEQGEEAMSTVLSGFLDDLEEETMVHPPKVGEKVGKLVRSPPQHPRRSASKSHARITIANATNTTNTALETDTLGALNSIAMGVNAIFWLMLFVVITYFVGLAIGIVFFCVWSCLETRYTEHFIDFNPFGPSGSAPSA